jgi:hypothetical protein
VRDEYHSIISLSQPSGQEKSGVTGEKKSGVTGEKIDTFIEIAY